MGLNLRAYEMIHGAAALEIILLDRLKEDRRTATGRTGTECAGSADSRYLPLGACSEEMIAAP